MASLDSDTEHSEVIALFCPTDIGKDGGVCHVNRLASTLERSRLEEMVEPVFTELFL